MNGMALCAGGGGLELGLRLALGDDYRCCVYVEREAYAASVLVARMEDATLDPAPIWDDLATFDGGAWRGCIDLISAGFPCQPFSVAGERHGLDDDRWLWPLIAPVVRAVGPRLLFLENSPELARHGLAVILGDLAEMGFDAEWDLFSASEAGAPHERKRIFLLAHAGRVGVGGVQPESGAGGGDPPVAGAGSPPLPNPNGSGRAADVDHDGAGQPDPPGCGLVGDADGNGCSYEWWVEELFQEGQVAQRNDPDGSDGAVGVGLADADRCRWETIDLSGHEESAESRESVGGRLPLFPPDKDDVDGWRTVLTLEPRLEPAVRRVAPWLAARVDGHLVAPWKDRVHVVGNGVVPLVAAHAFRTLWARLMAGAV